MTQKKEYGLLIRRENKHGTDYITAHLVARERPHDYPRGINGDGINEWDPTEPKHLHGLALDGLGMYGFVSDRDGHYIGFEIEYRDVYSMTLPKLERMHRTLKRAVARQRKDEAREPGDVFMSLANGFKLTFVVEQKSRQAEERTGNRWTWMTVAEGRNRFRQLIDETSREVVERIGLKAAS